jgi:hypothetical protein
LSRSDRLIWALLIVVVDTVVVVIPLCAMVLAYVIVARPAWFRRWVDDLYAAPR